MNKSTVTESAKSPPTIIRRRLGAIMIEASLIGDGRIGFVAEGPPQAIRNIAVALRSANFYVETYDDDPTTLYASCLVDDPREIAVQFDEQETSTRRYRRSWVESGVVPVTT